MTEDAGRDDPDSARPGLGVLAGRIAAVLVQHEPGWRLPRPTVLARRYNTSTADIALAVEELTARHLLRRQPGGQLYRASPAEYLITLDGLPSLGSHIDPMGAAVACISRHSTRRKRIPEDVGQALGLAPGEPGITIRCLWTADRCHAALSTTYLPDHPGPGQQAPFSLDAVLNYGWAVSPPAVPGSAWHPESLCVELQLPAPSVTRTLRLTPGEPAITVTVSFAGQHAGSLAAVTAVVLRPDLFRVVVQLPASGLSAAGAGGQAHAAEGRTP